MKAKVSFICDSLGKYYSWQLDQELNWTKEGKKNLEFSFLTTVVVLWTVTLYSWKKI